MDYEFEPQPFKTPTLLYLAYFVGTYLGDNSLRGYDMTFCYH